MPEKRGPSLMRALGLLAGDAWHAITGTPRPRRTIVSRTVEQREAQGPAGPVILRRTTVEEVEVRPPVPAPAPQR